MVNRTREKIENLVVGALVIATGGTFTSLGTEIFITSGSELYFRDQEIYINSGNDGELDLTCDGDLHVNCGSNKTLVLAEAVFDDIIVPSLELEKGAAAPDLVTFLASGGLKSLGFDGNATEESLHGAIEMLHKYKEGTNITPHLHWVPTDANAGNVVWQMEYTWINTGETFGGAATINLTDATDTTAWKHHKVDFSAISGTGKEIDSVLVFRIFRDPTHGSDTYTSDAILLDVGFHYEIDTIGSRQISTK